MRYIAAEDIARAKEMDLLTYLRNYEPQELVHVSGNTYCTKEHDSLRISNGKWCWFSQGIGGRSALDYLIKVKGIPFTQAAEIILGREAEKPPVFYRQKERKHTNLLMPELSETTDRVEKYLQGRGIHPVIIRYCLDNRLLFESADFHNAVFVGHDKDGKARYGALRSTVSSYKGELVGSGYPVVAILDMSDMWVTFNIKETLLPAIRVGTRMSGYVPALGYDVEFEVTYIAVQADFATWSATRTQGGFDIRTFAVKAKPTTHIENMRPGMSVLVDWDLIGK